MRTGLAASTVTPGRTAPDASFTTPAMEAWAYAAAGTRTTNTDAQNHPRNVCTEFSLLHATRCTHAGYAPTYTLQGRRKQQLFWYVSYLCTNGFGTSDAVEIQTLFTCRYSFSISWPLSRPMPERLYPPNGDR